MINFGKKVKLLRKERGLTQKQLADMVGVAVSAISAYEAGNRYPTYSGLVSLARIFHVSTDYLLGIANTRIVDVSGLDESEIDVIIHMINVLRERK